MFHTKNGYSLWLTNQVIETVKETINTENISTNQLEILEANIMINYILLYYHTLVAIIKSMNYSIQRILPKNFKTRITCTGRKHDTKFQINNLTKNPYEHDLIYYNKCPEPNCNKDYLGETGRIIIERTADHCRKDKQSHFLKHSVISSHPVVDLKDLKVIAKNYHGNKYKRKISAAFYINQYQPSLNAQEHSVHLKLFQRTVNFNCYLATN